MCFTEMRVPAMRGDPPTTPGVETIKVPMSTSVGAVMASIVAAASVGQRRIDDRPQLAPDVVLRRGHELRHEHDYQLLDGVDPERRAGCAAPAELTRRPRD